MRNRVHLILLFLITLSACITPKETFTPSLLLTALPTAQATRTPVLAIQPSLTTVSASLEASSPTPEIELPTQVITPTFTFELTIGDTQPPLPTLALPPMAATDIPQPAADSGAIQFLGPGPLSELVSPVNFYGYAVPGYNNKGYAVLYGEDGRVLASEAVQLYTAYKWAYLTGSLPFQVQGAGEFGRLTMSTQDEYGRLTSVYSVHLILLPEGNSLVNAPGDLKERCVIDQPTTGKRLSGGLLKVAGKMRPFNSLPLIVQLITRDGKVIASQPVFILPAANDSYVAFQSSLSYTISSGMWTRLTVSQADDRISGMMYLFSQEIFLYP